MPTLNITAVLRYENPMAAAQWLCDAFGFRIDAVHENPPGQVDHICMRYGAGVLLIGPASGSILGEASIDQGPVGGPQIQSCHLTVDDIEAHCARATSLGAQIEVPPQETGSGVRVYVCRDLEGHLWSFGTHDFGVQSALPAVLESASTPRQRGLGRGLPLAVLVLTALLGSAVTAGGFLVHDVKRDQIATVIFGGSTPDASPGEVGLAGGAQQIQVVESTERAQETDTLKALRAEVAELRRAREQADAASKLVADRLNAASVALSAAETRLKSTEGELAALRESEAVARLAASTAEAQLEVVSKQLADKADGEATLQQAVAQRDADRAEVEGLAASLHELRRSHQAALDSAKAAEAIHRAELSDKEARVAAVLKQLADKTEDKATLQQAVAQRDAARVEAERLAASLNELRRSHQAALDSIKAADAQRLAEVESKDKTIAAAAQQLQTARAEAAASIAVLADVRSRHQLELAEKDELIAALSTQLDMARKPLGEKKKKMPVEKSKKSAPVTAASIEPADLESMTSTTATPATLGTRCARAAYAQLLKRHGKSAQWVEAAANQVCEGVADSTEPARCLQLVLSGKVSYGIGRSWKTHNALNLCDRTLNARATIACFSKRVGAKETWQSAVTACRG